MSLLRIGVRGGAVSLVLVWARAAFAQTPPPAESPPAPEVAPAQPATEQPAPVQAAPVQPGTAQPAPVQPAAPAQPAGPTDEELAEKTRFRFAIHLMGGPWFVPDRSGGGGGLGLQLGAQINDMLGVYYSGSGAVGFAGSNDAAGIGSSVGAWFYNAVMADVTLANIFQVGAGPSLDTLAFASQDISASASGVSAKAAALGGTYFGLQTRLGLAIGKSKPGKKGRFMLGLEIHPTFAAIVPVSAFITVGGGTF